MSKLITIDKTKFMEALNDCPASKIKGFKGDYFSKNLVKELLEQSEVQPKEDSASGEELEDYHKNCRKLAGVCMEHNPPDKPTVSKCEHKDIDISNLVCRDCGLPYQPEEKPTIPEKLDHFVYEGNIEKKTIISKLGNQERKPIKRNLNKIMCKSCEEIQFIRKHPALEWLANFQISNNIPEILDANGNNLYKSLWDNAKKVESRE